MVSVKNIDIDTVRSERCVSVCRISEDIIQFLKKRMPNLPDISHEREIVFWSDRIEHTLRHKDDFASDVLFEDCLRDIPDFIEHPDYISVKKDGSSVSFIRTLSQNIAVVVRVTTAGGLSYRTMYPLLSAQLDKYLNDGTAWKYSN